MGMPIEKSSPDYIYLFDIIIYILIILHLLPVDFILGTALKIFNSRYKKWLVFPFFGFSCFLPKGKSYDGIFLKILFISNRYIQECLYASKNQKVV